MQESALAYLSAVDLDAHLAHGRAQPVVERRDLERDRRGCRPDARGEGLGADFDECSTRLPPANHESGASACDLDEREQSARRRAAGRQSEADSGGGCAGREPDDDVQAIPLRLP
jgi:hypothetical protein